MITGIPPHIPLHQPTEPSPHICHLCGKHFKRKRNVKTHIICRKTQLGGNHNIGGRMSGWEGGKSSGVSIGAEQTPQLPPNWVIKSRRKYFFPHYLIWWLSDVEGGVSATMALLDPHYLETWFASVARQFLPITLDRLDTHQSLGTVSVT